MNRLEITPGMRVLNASGRHHRECTVIRLTVMQTGEQYPSYALVRYDNPFLRDDWEHVMHLYPLHSAIPTNSKQDGGQTDPEAPISGEAS